MYAHCDVSSIDADLGRGILDGFGFNKESSTKREVMDVPDLAEYAHARTVTITAEGVGVGGGFFVDDQGTVVTCYHVIDGATGISVRANDEASYEIQSIIDFDEIHDIAALYGAYLSECHRSVMYLVG